MCHSLDLDGRLPADHPALAAADLLLMKLQVVELNHKDVTDAAALLSTHRLGDDDAAGSINRRRIVEVLAGDWGFYTTATDNLERLPDLVAALDAELGAHGRRMRPRRSGRTVDAAPKSRAFKLRARVGAASAGTRCPTSRSPTRTGFWTPLEPSSRSTLGGGRLRRC